VVDIKYIYIVTVKVLIFSAYIQADFSSSIAGTWGNGGTRFGCQGAISRCGTSRDSLIYILFLPIYLT